jgi:hypothetical protein
MVSGTIAKPVSALPRARSEADQSQGFSSMCLIRVSGIISRMTKWAKQVQIDLQLRSWLNGSNDVDIHLTRMHLSKCLRLPLLK